ncbi:SRPBCC family protein [Sphaerisporangium sp. B11E5]|uniref:SRPBCC family protein n=1 Tax=Sphaerisporangium sp. B11E5 TaxID=3153563 RepID=UPI00325CB62D
MSTIEHSVDVAVPVRTAYNQWTQFESFHEFMEGVESVKQIDDTRLAWSVQVAGVHREFEAEITEQRPDERVAWRSLEEPRQAGLVTFERLDDDSTRVNLRMDFDPEGFVETVGDKLQLVRMRVHGDLERFKAFIEARGHETGGWRGEVPIPGGGGGWTEDEGAARTAPDGDVLRGTGTGTPDPTGIPTSTGTTGTGVPTRTSTPDVGAAGAVPVLDEPVPEEPVPGPRTRADEPAPPRQVGGEYPPETPLPAPGTGPVSPLGTPRWDDEPPLTPERRA